KASSWNTFPFWSDSPSKLRKDVQTARAKTPGTPRSAVTDNRDGAILTTSLKDNTGTLPATGAIPPREGPALTSTAPARSPAAPKGQAATVAPPAHQPADPHVLLQQGRDKLQAGDFKEAERLGIMAKTAAGNMSWGIFHDTPDKLLKDVDKARKEKDRDQSI